MSISGRGGEFRVELTGEKPGVVRDFYDFYQRAVGRTTRDPETCLGQEIQVIVIELIAVTMAFENDLLTINFPQFRPVRQMTFILTKAHGAAQVTFCIPGLQLIALQPFSH